MHSFVEQTLVAWGDGPYNFDWLLYIKIQKNKIK